MKSKSFFIIFYCFAFLTLFLIDNAYAYLDPGTGSMLLQALVAAIAGAAFIVKTYWTKIKIFFVKKEAQPKSSGDQDKN